MLINFIVSIDKFQLKTKFVCGTCRAALGVSEPLQSLTNLELVKGLFSTFRKALLSVQKIKFLSAIFRARGGPIQSE